MRKELVIGILAIGLLATPLAAADEGPSAKGKATASEHSKRGNPTENDTHEGKPAWVASFQESLRALRASWLENASKVRESCQAKEKPANDSSREERTARSHCVRDGYKSWFQVLKLEMKEAREEMKAARASWRS